MSLAKIIVLFLRLASLGGILFSLVLIVCPFLIPEEIPNSAAQVFSPGCFSILMAVMLLPLSLVPAAIAWGIQERNVKPQQAAENAWREAALSREERLGIWMRYVADSLMKHRRLRDTHDDPVPILLQTEIPRALHEFDPARRARLLRFLQEADVANAREAVDFPSRPDPVSAEMERMPPRRGLVSLVTGAFALLSGFFLLWAGLALVTLLFANPLQAVGANYSRPAELVLGLSCLLIPSLVCGLASAGLWRLYQQSGQSLEEAGGDREVTQKIALKSVQNQIEALARSMEVGDCAGESLAQKIIRAMVAVTIPELDGLHLAKLVCLLYDAGWLQGEKAVPMDGLSLRAMELEGASLSCVCLSGADLSGADLSSADLRGADLRRCTLYGSDLRSVRLAGANLHGADLRYSRLQKANLERADLGAVLLGNANFWGANLVEAELGGARGDAEYLVLAENI